MSDKKATVAYLNVLLLYLPQYTEEHHEEN